MSTCGIGLRVTGTYRPTSQYYPLIPRLVRRWDGFNRVRNALDYLRLVVIQLTHGWSISKYSPVDLKSSSPP